MEGCRLAVYVITYIFEFAVIYVYCRNMFQSKYNKSVEIAVGLIGFVGIGLILFKGLFGVLFENIVWINTLFYFIFYFLYIFCLFYAKPYSALLHSAVFTSVMSASEVVTYSVTRSVTFFFDENALFNNLVVNTLASKLLYAFLMYIIFLISRKLRKVDANRNSSRISLIIVTVSLVSVFNMCVLLTLIARTYANPHYGHITSWAAVCVIIPNIAIYMFYIYLQRKNDEFSRLQIQLQKERDLTEYYKLLISQNESQSILIHDIKKHLQSIALLNEQKDNERIAVYIDNITHSSDLQESVKVSDNKLLNAIINRYVGECQKKNIDLHTDIRRDTVNFMREDDLTALFCNILDNACASASKEKDSFIELIVGKGENTDYTVVTMKNSCGENPFLPRHKNTRHGYGLKSVERIAASYDGHMKTYFEEGENIYHTIITLKNPAIF